ncbi:hypothetical protein [Streptomyces sp. NBC_01264]|uniref:hypothetical protein n=1 Tax=Streptomyces sp. NBC_01264 TaxID=2903804 RepID=UPI0022576E5F|nr:hypothetical protein [Streptomyces sp. NBC_01264]MCX4783343.1 hypothetical protein [Streptomyces sp. NBC_01264]
MNDTVTVRRILPTDNPMGGGANVADMRSQSHERAVMAYFNKDRISSPQAMALTPSQGGMFDGLREEAFRSEAPRSAYSDIV